MIITNNTIQSYFLGGDPAQYLGVLKTLVLPDYLYFGDDDIAIAINSLFARGAITVNDQPTGFPRGVGPGVVVPDPHGRADGEVLQTASGTAIWADLPDNSKVVVESRRPRNIDDSSGGVFHIFTPDGITGGTFTLILSGEETEPIDWDSDLDTFQNNILAALNATSVADGDLGYD